MLNSHILIVTALLLSFQTEYTMSVLVVGVSVRGLQLPSGVVRARGLHTSLVVTAGEKMGKPDPK